MSSEEIGRRRREELTKEKLRTFKGFENIKDKEAEEIIYSIKELSSILYQYYINTQNKTSDERPPTI